MKAALCLEYIGEGFAEYEKLLSLKVRSASLGKESGAQIANVRKPWVAEILAVSNQFGYDRRFLSGKFQRKRGAATGNRGTELWFTLESGRIYQIQYFASWRDKRRYFATVADDGEIVGVDEEWVRNRLALMSSPPQGSA